MTASRTTNRLDRTLSIVRRGRHLSLAHVLLASVALFLVTAGFAGGLAVERFVIGHDGPGGPLDAAMTVIENDYYYRPTDEAGRATMESGMEQGAMSGALSSLDDQYTRYLGPDDSRDASADLSGIDGGVGIEVRWEQGVAVIWNVVERSPAANAGIQRGDVLTRVDGAEPANGDTAALERMLRGDVGSNVSLEIVNPESGSARTYDLVREEVIVPQVVYHPLPDTTYAVIAISIFGDQTTSQLDAALAQAKSDGVTGLVLDLRGNGGGWVRSAQETLGRFLSVDVGPAFYEDATPGPGEDMAVPIIAPANGSVSRLPVVVLVDGSTASAAEIVAGSLKDYDRAIVVGEQTFGKGSVQRIYEFSDASTMRVTVAEWFTPSKGRIQGRGIAPDIAVDNGAHPTTDYVLGAAIDCLNTGRTRPSMLTATPATGTPAATPAG